MSRGFMAVATMLMRSNYLGLPPRVVSVSQLANNLLTNYLVPEATFVPQAALLDSSAVRRCACYRVIASLIIAVASYILQRCSRMSKMEPSSSFGPYLPDLVAISRMALKAS